MAGVAKLLDARILNKSNGEVDLTNDRYRGQIVALYFSAHWCPPCRAFTPLLTDLYAQFHREKHVQVIFISSDHDEKTFKEYYKSMPWLALDYKERKKKDELFKRFNVTDIPKLVLLDGDTGKIICSNAKEQMLYLDREGTNFPWNSAQ